MSLVRRKNSCDYFPQRLYLIRFTIVRDVKRRRCTPLAARHKPTESHGFLNCSMPSRSLQNKCVDCVFYESHWYPLIGKWLLESRNYRPLLVSRTTIAVLSYTFRSTARERWWSLNFSFFTIISSTHALR